jgi:type I restriction enzyme M protein
MPNKNMVEQETIEASKKSDSGSSNLASTLKTARNIMRKDKGLNGDLDRLPMLTWLMFLKFLDDLEANREIEAQLSGEKYTPLISSPHRWRDWAVNAILTGDELLEFINSDEIDNPFANSKSEIPGLFSYLRNLSSSTEDDTRKDVIATVFKGTDNRMKNGYLLRDVINKINRIRFGSSSELHTLSGLYEGMLREMRDAAGDSGEFYTPRSIVRFMVDVIDPKLGEKVLDPACGTGGFLVEAFAHLEKQVVTVEDRRSLQKESIQGCEAKSLPYLLCQMNLLLHGVESPIIDPGNSLRMPLTEIGDKERVEVILANPPFGGEEEAGIRANFPSNRQTSETAILFLQLIMRKLKRQGSGRAAVVVPNTTLFDSGVTARVREDLMNNFNLYAIMRLPKGVFEPYTDIETNILFFNTESTTESITFYELPLPVGKTKYAKTFPLRYEELSEAVGVIQGTVKNSLNSWQVDPKVVLADPRVSLDLRNPKISFATSENPADMANQLLDGLRVLAGATNGLSDAISKATHIAENVDWVSHKLNDLLVRRKDVVDIEDDVIYRRLKIQLYGKGISVRDEVPGSEIGTKRQFQVEAGMFLLSKIDARNGAFGLIPDEGAGAIITGNFWAYDYDEEFVVPRLLVYLTRSNVFLEFCRLSSPGMTNRRYLQEDIFLAQKIKVPKSKQDQETLCQALDYIEYVFQRDLSLLAIQSQSLLQATLHKIFGEGQFDPSANLASSIALTDAVALEE